MEIIIAKWEPPFNGNEYTLHFAEDDSPFQVMSAIDQLGDPGQVEARLIDWYNFDGFYLDPRSIEHFQLQLKTWFDLGEEVSVYNN